MFLSDNLYAIGYKILSTMMLKSLSIPRVSVRITTIYTYYEPTQITSAERWPRYLVRPGPQY